MMMPPNWQAALAGGADAMSAPAVSTPAASAVVSPATRNCFMLLGHYRELERRELVIGDNADFSRDECRRQHTSRSAPAPTDRAEAAHTAATTDVATK
jgi:hypothetical protein